MKRLLGILAAALIATAAQAQNVQYPTAQGHLNAPGYVAMCISSTGVAVPAALCDTLPGVTNGFKPARPDQQGQVVSISPNSGSTGPYPSNSIPLEAAATGTTAAVAASLAAQPGRTNYVCGISASPGSATTAITITEILSGLSTSMTWNVGAPVTAVGTTGAIFTQNFAPCIPASAVNTAITLTQSALGTAGIGADVQIWGYRQ